MHTVVHPHNLHELKNDAVYFPNTCSWWYCEWLIGACYFIVKDLCIWNLVCLLILMPVQTRVTVFLPWNTKGEFFQWIRTEAFRLAEVWFVL